MNESLRLFQRSFQKQSAVKFYDTWSNSGPGNNDCGSNVSIIKLTEQPFSCLAYSQWTFKDFESKEIAVFCRWSGDGCRYTQGFCTVAINQYLDVQFTNDLSMRTRKPPLFYFTKSIKLPLIEPIFWAHATAWHVRQEWLNRVNVQPSKSGFSNGPWIRLVSLTVLWRWGLRILHCLRGSLKQPEIPWAAISSRHLEVHMDAFVIVADSVRHKQHGLHYVCDKSSGRLLRAEKNCDLWCWGSPP